MTEDDDNNDIVQMEKLDSIVDTPLAIKQDKDNEKEENEDDNEEGNKKSCCKFPSAYTILAIIQVIIFLLTYIIPQGKFDKLEYSDDMFVITYSDNTQKKINATQEELEKLNIKINLTSFTDGLITKPVSIPGTYKRIDGELMNFLELFLLPMLGIVDSASISFLLIIIGGNLNLLTEMKALSAGMSSLANILKGKEFILLILCFLLVSIGGTTFGMCEEILAFYPILMPIFLKNGLDGILGTASLYFGSNIGTMFSTINAFSVVIGSYSAGISFSEGIVFRVICLVLGDLITIGYFYYYYRKIKNDEKNSLVYNIKDKLIKKFIKKKKEETNEENNKLIEIENDDEVFTIKRKIIVILFVLAFAVFIVGIIALDWWFEQAGAVFLVSGIIFMFLSCQGEEKSIQIFMKGAGDFVGVAICVGLARGINITLENGLISDTILNALSSSIGDLPKVGFSIVMLFIFFILGFVIQSSSGLAILSMPIFSPLADNVGVKRSLVINAYMFAQNFVGIISPTSLILIVLQMTGVPYNSYLKFCWPFCVILFVILIVLMIINAFI